MDNRCLAVKEEGQSIVSTLLHGEIPKYIKLSHILDNFPHIIVALRAHFKRWPCFHHQLKVQCIPRYRLAQSGSPNKVGFINSPHDRSKARFKTFVVICQGTNNEKSPTYIRDKLSDLQDI
jgi:hypothetical protein